jgi:pSer/pThr/pTyr-binding forkhead associated (FHA) protein
MEKTPTLIVSIPESAPTTFELRGDRVGLGREVDNQIQVNSGAVSSCHCEFRKTDAGYEIADLESTNGTRVNGKKITAQALGDGDRILLGETVAVHFVELAVGQSVEAAVLAGCDETNKAAASYTKMDEKLQSIEADIAAKESAHKEIAASLEEVTARLETKKAEQKRLLASMKDLEAKIAQKKTDAGEANSPEVAALEKELMLQTRKVQVLATDIDGQRQQLHQMQAPAPILPGAPPVAAPPVAPPQAAPPVPAVKGPIKVAAMAPPTAASPAMAPLPDAPPQQPAVAPVPIPVPIAIPHTATPGAAGPAPTGAKTVVITPSGTPGANANRLVVAQSDKPRPKFNLGS